jgi:hypothetical protein
MKRGSILLLLPESGQTVGQAQGLQDLGRRFVHRDRFMTGRAVLRDRLALRGLVASSWQRKQPGTVVPDVFG